MQTQEFFSCIIRTVRIKIEMQRKFEAEELVMKITDVRVRKIKSDGKLKAYVTVTFDNAFVIHNVKWSKEKTVHL